MHSTGFYVPWPVSDFKFCRSATTSSENGRRPKTRCYPCAHVPAGAAAYEAALARIFGTGAGEARDDRARNGSRPDHPLHLLYAAKTKATGCWFAFNRPTMTGALARHYHTLAG